METRTGESTTLDGDLTSSNDPAAWADYVDGEPASVERVTGYCARYSAPGYMDCTEWVGPYATEEEAIRECKSLYGDDNTEEENES